MELIPSHPPEPGWSAKRCLTGGGKHIYRKRNNFFLQGFFSLVYGKPGHKYPASEKTGFTSRPEIRESSGIIRFLSSVLASAIFRYSSVSNTFLYRFRNHRNRYPFACITAYWYNCREKGSERTGLLLPSPWESRYFPWECNVLAIDSICFMDMVSGKRVGCIVHICLIVRKPEFPPQ